MLSNSTFQIAGTRRGEDGGTLHWPFEFAIPEYSEGVSPEKMELHSADALPEWGGWPGSAAYFDNVPFSQPLPDSLPAFNQIGTGYRVNVEGSVSYKVRVEVPGMGAGWKSLWIGKMDSDVVVPVVNLSSRRDMTTEQVRWQEMRFVGYVRTLRLLPTHAEGRLSFKERTRSIFKKSALPSLGVTITFHAPQTLFIDAADDDPLPFLLSIARTRSAPGADTSRTTSAAGGSLSSDTQILGEKDSVSESGENHDIPVPQVYLTRLSVTLVAHSQVRTNLSTKRYMDPGEAETFAEHEIFEYRYQKANEGDRKIELPLSQTDAGPSSSSPSNTGFLGHAKSAELGSRPSTGQTQWSIGEQLGVNHAMLRALGPSIVPDFTTPNLARSYLLQWEVRVECCGEEVSWRSIKEGGLGVSIQRQGVGAAGNLGDAGVVDAPVPAYGDARPAYSYYGGGGARQSGGDGVEGLVPRMANLNVNNVVAGVSGEQLPSYEGSSSGHGYRNVHGRRPPEKGYVNQQP